MNSGALSLVFMEASPSRPTYRTAGWVVIFVSFGLGMLLAQSAQRTSVSKGPRAVALLRLQPDGKAQLIPVSIMVDGRFFDANAYKASPVPMALEGGTVYEAEKTGDSLGLFTVTNVMQQKSSFIGIGNWRPAGSVEPATGLKAEASPREEEDKPPTLRRGGAAPTQPGEKKSASKAGSAPTPDSKPASPAPSDDDDRPRLKSSTPPKDQPPASPPATQPTQSASTTAPSGSPPATESEPDDPSRPKLKRGKQPQTQAKAAPATKPPTKSVAAPNTVNSTKKQDHPIAADLASPPSVQLIPAISDANGPEPRPYSYEMKPQEEQTFRKKILAAAAEEVWKQAKLSDPSLTVAAAATKGNLPKGKGAASKTPQPAFEDVKLRVFDVATNNEPILVLTAKASYPQRTSNAAASDQRAPTYFVTLVAHSDMYGELRKLLSAVTDDRHLDVSPRMGLIDAVDADGDGRAELLFEQTFDTGKAYVIYRVGADQLWALYQGSPSGPS